MFAVVVYLFYLLIFMSFYMYLGVVVMISCYDVTTTLSFTGALSFFVVYK